MQHVKFEAHNTWTHILEWDELILDILDREARYPTPQAIDYAKGGWAPPSGEGGGWDGWIRLLHRPKTYYPYFPTGLLPRLVRICEKMQYQAHVTDNRVRPHEGFPEFPKVELRDYQEAAVAAGIKLGRGVFDMPPRAGKTRTALELHRRLSLPTIWIAPTDRIVTQTHDVIEGHFGKNYCMHLVGSKRLPEAENCKVVVCTTATAASLPASFYATREMLIVDEFHHGAADSYAKEIIPKCDHIYFRYGMTGTFFRSGDDAMAMHALLSNTIYKVSSAELLQRGFLVATKVVFIPVPEKPKVRGAGNQFSGGFGKAGIHEHVYRNHMVATTANYLYQLGRKVLILVGTKAQGNFLAKTLEGMLPQPPKGCQFASVEFLSTDRPRSLQTQILESFLAGQEVKILMGTSLLGEGVDLPDVDALVYARGEKAQVSMTQNAFRVCTAVPGKKDALIVDFADRHHRHLLAHSQERLLTYYREPAFEVSTLADLSAFPLWLQAGMPTAVNFGGSIDLFQK